MVHSGNEKPALFQLIKYEFRLPLEIFRCLFFRVVSRTSGVLMKASMPETTINIYKLLVINVKILTGRQGFGKFL